jgi:hypothetical protein
MLEKMARRALGALNGVLGLAGIKIVRRGPRPLEEFRDYIAFKPTITAARDHGLSVGDYIDLRHNRPGATQETIDRLKEMGALHGGIRRICEIGPGSGRYLERTIAVCRPEHYEVYETAEEWRQYLLDRYPVIAQPTDGRSLAATPSESIDLVHAHKVFSGTPFLVTVRYFSEMARVVVPGGKVVFDLVTEPCMDAEILANWLSTGAGYQLYPSLLPRQYVIGFFERRGLSCDGTFMVPMKPGIAECFVFTRRPS